MLKRLVFPGILLASSPGFSHTVPFDGTNYLKMTKGDTRLANDLSQFCTSSGKGFSTCAKAFVTDKRRAEAAAKCMRQINNPPGWIDQFKSPEEILAGKAHKYKGEHWHTDMRTDFTGHTHSHDWSATARDLAVRKYATKLTVDARKKYDAEVAKSTKTVSGKGAMGSDLEVAEAKYEASATKTVTTEALPKAVIDQIAIDAEKARVNPELGDVDPDIMCEQDEPVCEVAGGTHIKNPHYDPKPSKEKQEKAAKEQKVDETLQKSGSKKSAEEAAAKETGDEEVTADINENDDLLFAAENDEDWVTPVDPLEVKGMSYLEQCAEKEYYNALVEDGTTHKDPDALQKAERESKALNNLKLGMCDASVLGDPYCQVWKIKRSQTKGTPDKEVSDEAKKANALKSWHLGGSCDPVVLGSAFCDGEKKALETTKADKTTSNGGAGVIQHTPQISPIRVSEGSGISGSSGSGRIPTLHVGTATSAGGGGVIGSHTGSSSDSHRPDKP